jgi:HlyD family secretion protein
VPSIAELDTGRATAARATAELASAKAATAQARATLEAQRTDLGKAAIRTPIDGIVLKRAIEPGQTVAASLQAPILFTLAEDLRQMELLVAVDEADVSSVAEGQRARFTVDAWPTEQFDAQVVQVRYGADALEGVVTYGALLRVENPERRLRPGMTATAEITVKRIPDALLVPNAALRFSPPEGEDEAGIGDQLRGLVRWRGRFPQRDRATREGAGATQIVHRLRDGALERLEITTGATDGTATEVLGGGLAQGDALAVDAQAAK